MKQVNILTFARKYGLLVCLFLMACVLTVLSDAFLTVQNITNVIRQISINGILALGMTFVVITGGIDLSVGSIVAVAGVVVGKSINANPESILPAILLAIAVCTLFGVLSGTAIAKFNIAPFVITMATMTIGRGFALVYSDGRPYVLNSKLFSQIGKGEILSIPIPILIFLLIIAISALLLHATKFGRYVFAIGGNEDAAKASGVKVKLIKVAVYGWCGLLSGVAGIILASRINSGQPAVGAGYELDAIAAAVIGGTSLNGGRGSIPGTIMGVLIIGFINNGLNLLNVSSYYQLIIKGFIIAGAVLLDQVTKKGGK
jgi:ribose/xylose/arabinose/galactoside ABC-type transport system permease subunit